MNAYLFGMAAVGALMVSITFRRLDESATITYAYWGGMFLLAMAVGFFLFLEHAIITVDEEKRELQVSKKSRIGNRSYTIPFASVDTVALAAVGKSHRGVVSHHLVIHLKNGDRETPGLTSIIKSDIEMVADKLAVSIGCPVNLGRQYHPFHLKQFAIAAAGAVFVYAIWYRATTGALCAAMWGGTLPPIIMLTSFFVIFRTLRQKIDFKRAA